MKLRDILILAGLVLLIVVLTVAEQYAVRRREQRQEQEQAVALREWEGRIAAAFESRWTTLSSGLHQTLDSIAQDILATGVSHDSLAAIMAQSQTSSAATTESPTAATPQTAPKSDTLSTQDLAKAVLLEYEKALKALPRDLNAYEKRVATNEVASLVRAKFGLSPERFDRLLKQAATQ